MEKLRKLQPAASAVGSLNSKVSAIGQEAPNTDKTRRLQCQEPRDVSKEQYAFSANSICHSRLLCDILPLRWSVVGTVGLEAFS